MSITYDRTALRAKADQYCQGNNTSVKQQLGYGTQGVVFLTERNSVVKVHSLKQGYQRERDAYRRLQERNIVTVRGLMIPRIKNWDDQLFAFEMSMVHVPCVLDFGGAYLDQRPEHVIRDDQWFEEKASEFGENWQEAQAVIREIECRGDIWMSDVNTGNIKFE
jgi:hypothetical protein